MMQPMAFRPLAGIRVLDLTSSLAGPTATEILGALGADVVKIEHPGRGDEARDWGPRFFEGGSVMFFSANAGKRSLALDLKSPEGLEALLRLADGADVAVQSLRPGTAERLGFGPEALRARNPRLVYATIGAFGRNGPLASEPGYDPLMQAAAGIMSVTGEPDGHPVRVGVSLIDIGTGVWAALAIVAALHEGQGTDARPLALRDGALARPVPARRRPRGRRACRAARHRVPADRPVPGVRDGRRRADDRGGERPPLREGLPGGGRAGACGRRALHHEPAPHRQPRAADPAAAGADRDRDDGRRCSPGSATRACRPRR